MKPTTQLGEPTPPAATAAKSPELPKTLVVCCTVSDRTRSDWASVLNALTTPASAPNCTSLLAQTGTQGSITEAAVDLKAQIDQSFIVSGPYESVLLIGVGVGGIIVRLAYLLSLGFYPDSPPNIRWGERVTRIALIATPNRGIGLDVVPALMKVLIRAVLHIQRTSRYFVDLSRAE